MKYLFIGVFILIATFSRSFYSAASEKESQKIVFDVTSADTNVHKSVMLIIKVMAANYPNSTLEVSVYGGALPMLMKGRSSVDREIARYRENANVIFTACEVSMQLLFNIDRSDLLPGVGTVENALPDIVRKQTLRWGYIKTGV